MFKTIVVATIAVATLASCRKAERPAPSTQPPAARGLNAPQTTGAAPQREATPASTNVGDPMPAYHAKTLDGAPYDFAAEKGRVVLVNVWATWCGPCRFEIPELQKLHDANAARGFKVVGISVDEGDPAEVKQFVGEQKMTYPVVLDPDGRIANLLQTTVLPTSVLIDASGTIVWRQVGAIMPNDAKLREALARALRAANG